jgi:hypothetical protein
MFTKGLYYTRYLSLLILLFLIYNCSNNSEPLIYIYSTRGAEIKARIVADSTVIFRSERNNGSLSVPITYKAVLLDDEIDSLEWIFPNGEPSKVNESMSTTVNYSKYGSYN